MRISSLAKIMIGIEDVVVKDVSFDEDAQAIVIDAKALQAPLLQMRQVRAEGPYHDAGRGTRLWRCPDVVGTKVYVQADAFRVRCPKCDTAVRKVPWADHRSWQPVPLRTAAAGLCRR